jgi:hypothetical protein
MTNYIAAAQNPNKDSHKNIFPKMLKIGHFLKFLNFQNRFFFVIFGFLSKIFPPSQQTYFYSFNKIFKSVVEILPKLWACL